MTKDKGQRTKEKGRRKKYKGQKSNEKGQNTNCIKRKIFFCGMFLTSKSFDNEY